MFNPVLKQNDILELLGLYFSVGHTHHSGCFRVWVRYFCYAHPLLHSYITLEENLFSVCHSDADFRLSSFMMSCDQSSKWHGRWFSSPVMNCELATVQVVQALGQVRDSQIFRPKPLKIRTLCKMSPSALYASQEYAVPTSEATGCLWWLNGHFKAEEGKLARLGGGGGPKGNPDIKHPAPFLCVCVCVSHYSLACLELYSPGWLHTHSIHLPLPHECWY